MRTDRGRHRYYSEGDEKLPVDLRPFGLAAEIRQGRSIVVAPPSIHESGSRYALEGADWSALNYLPPLNVEGLRRFIVTHAKPKRAPCAKQLRDGSRGLGLNSYLCSVAALCCCFGELLDMAHAWNHSLTNPLPDDEVARRAKDVWRDYEVGKIELWHGVDSKASRDDAIMDTLARINPKDAGDAWMLLTKLRRLHTLRCRRGEPFGITPRGMVRAQTIPLWPRGRYERARDLLLAAGPIVKLSDYWRDAAGHNHRAEYTFAEMIPLRAPR